MAEVLKPAGAMTVQEARTWHCEVIDRRVQPDRVGCQQFEART